MNFKRFHESKNLALPFENWYDGFVNTYGTISPKNQLRQERYCDYIAVKPNTQYSFSCKNGFPHSSDDLPWRGVAIYKSDKTYIRRPSNELSSALTFTTDNNAAYVRLSCRTYGENLDIMLNEGSTALPYEPYGDPWHDIPHYIMGTDTDTITTLPADIYANDTTATVGLKGNMEQSGTPTPTTPIQPSEVTATYKGWHPVADVHEAENGAWT